MDFYRNWFLASRPWSLTMTAVSIATGFIYAATPGDINWFWFLLTLLAGTFVHLASNLLNDYFDVKNGIDTAFVSTARYRPHPLVEGNVTPQKVFWASIALYSLAAVIGIALVLLRGVVLLWIGLAGMLLAMTYTAPPLRYKYKGLGELGVLIIWGPLMIGGSFFIQTASLNESVIILSVPLGLLVALVLYINNVRDIINDRDKKISTLAIFLTSDFAIHFYTFLIILAFVWVIVISIFGPLTLFSLLVLLSLPLAINLIKKMYRQVPDNADAETARLVTLFGVLLLISMLMSHYYG